MSLSWSERERRARAIARALTSVAWDRADLVAVLEAHSPRPRPYWPHLVERLMQQFGEAPGTISLEVLTWVVCADPIFEPSYRRRMASATGRRGWRPAPQLSREVFAPTTARFRPGAAASWPVPAIESIPELASRFGVPDSTLEGWADVGGWLGRLPADRRQHYHRTWRGERLIEAPKPQLKKMQRWVLREILERVPAHPAAHGFVKGRSVRTHAARHVGQQVLMQYDLRRFFPSIPVGRVRGLFRYVGYPPEVAAVLAGLCTTVTPPDTIGRRRAREVVDLYARRHLPQGAPTSPALANLVCFALDRRLAGLARRFGAAYSRYADDLTFSGGPSLARRHRQFTGWVTRVIESEGFTVHGDKTRRRTAAMRQQVTGVVVNRKLSSPRAEFDRLKAILHQCALDGPEGHNRDGHADFRAHLLGRIAWVNSLDPGRGAKLRARFDRIVWPQM